MEKIVCAAIWYKDIVPKSFDGTPIPSIVENGVVVSGMRHGDCIYTLIALTGMASTRPSIGSYVQGFITTNNRFVDRVEAASIAFDAKQIQSPTSVLFSEDLY